MAAHEWMARAACRPVADWERMTPEQQMELCLGRCPVVDPCHRYGVDVARSVGLDTARRACKGVIYAGRSLSLIADRTRRGAA